MNPGHSAASSRARAAAFSDSPMQTMPVHPASPARSTTASRSSSNASLARWAWLSMKLDPAIGTPESAGILSGRIRDPGERRGRGGTTDGCCPPSPLPACPTRLRPRLLRLRHGCCSERALGAYRARPAALDKQEQTGANEHGAEGTHHDPEDQQDGE